MLWSYCFKCGMYILQGFFYVRLYCHYELLETFRKIIFWKRIVCTELMHFWNASFVKFINFPFISVSINSNLNQLMTLKLALFLKHNWIFWWGKQNISQTFGHHGEFPMWLIDTLYIYLTWEEGVGVETCIKTVDVINRPPHNDKKEWMTKCGLNFRTETWKMHISSHAGDRVLSSEIDKYPISNTKIWHSTNLSFQSLGMLKLDTSRI